MDAEPIRYSVGEDLPPTQKLEEPSMSEQFHKYAQEDTPAKVSVPENWPGIIMWAVGRHGPIVLFVWATWLLYNDNKATQEQIHKDARESQTQMMEVAKAQIDINGQVVAQMSDVKLAIKDLVEEAKRAHHFNSTEK